MTKTESANRTVQAVVIEACEQLLECWMAEGCRLAIPNTNNLIMVGPQEWIAENVLAVEAMVGREPAHIPQTADEVIAFIGNHYDSMEQRDDDTETRFQLSVHDLLSAFRWWFDTDLAATTQASTAQAERAKLLCSALIAASKWAGAEHLHACNIGRGGPGEGKAVERAENAARKAITALANVSSTDAQAAAEVRDAAPVDLPTWDQSAMLVECDGATPLHVFIHDQEPDAPWDMRFRDQLQAALDYVTSDRARALRAGDTGEQADGGAAEQEGA